MICDILVRLQRLDAGHVHADGEVGENLALRGRRVRRRGPRGRRSAPRRRRWRGRPRPGRARPPSSPRGRPRRTCRPPTGDRARRRRARAAAPRRGGAPSTRRLNVCVMEFVVMNPNRSALAGADGLGRLVPPVHHEVGAVRHVGVGRAEGLGVPVAERVPHPLAPDERRVADDELGLGPRRRGAGRRSRRRGCARRRRGRRGRVVGLGFVVTPSHTVTGSPSSPSLGRRARPRPARRRGAPRCRRRGGSARRGPAAPPYVRRCHCKNPIHSTRSAMAAARGFTSMPRSCAGVTAACSISSAVSP